MVAEVAVLDASIQTLIDVVQPFIKKASLILGGAFGIYVILLFARVHYERKKVSLLKDIRYDLDQLNMSKGITYSRQRHGIFKRMWRAITRWRVRTFSKLPSKKK
ncbi:TPA: hypothetical protein HA278_01600 [Candidatus Woesearchaeota archaeon]|jgi:hypothetical protein|nr:hypothetical protein [archaeon]HIJ10729.1 hypothetical protein [Candidatus Woesearchaeota archaeon]